MSDHIAVRFLRRYPPPPSRYNPVPVWLELTRAEFNFGLDLGYRRAAERQGAGARHRNNLTTTFERNIKMHQSGAISEAAYFKAFGGSAAGVKWDTSAIYRPGRPDLIFRGIEYDAKGIKPNRYSLCIWHDSRLPLGGVHPNWRYLLAGLEHAPAIALIGWALGSDVMRYRLEDRNLDGRRAHYLPGDELRDVRSLELCRAMEPKEQFEFRL